MSENTASLNTLWATLIIEELVRNRVTTFVISPGSRSTPLTVAAARNPKAETVVHFDERGAAFFALGVAKASGFPCALICTSGTAVANYFPAIVEASQSCVPLIVLTADRPPELQNTGANQTINQTEIYGVYARKYIALPCPDDGKSAKKALKTIDDAVVIALSRPPGPIHINCPFREPLGPAPFVHPKSLSWWSASDSCLSDDAGSVEIRTTEMELHGDSGRILVVNGNCSHGLEADLPSAWPVIADVGSSIRSRECSPNTIVNFDLLLLSRRFREFARPEIVFHIGGPVVSKRTMEFFAECKPQAYHHFSSTDRRIDPYAYVTDLSACDSLTVRADNPNDASEWTRNIAAASNVAEQVIASLLDARTEITEPGLVRLIAHESAKWHDNSIFLGNSMPVRDMDMFSGYLGAHSGIITNRGASGIDGNIATAAGFSKASGKHVTAIVGDIATLHDLNSLALLARDDVAVTLIVINNDGGGIFNFLPIADQADVFETCFATPHGRRFGDAARMFGLAYAQPANMNEFLAEYRKACATGKSQVIEVFTDRNENRRLHREIGDAVAAAVDEFLGKM